MEFRDLKAQYNKYKNEIDHAILNTINEGRFIGGEKVTQLEKRLAKYTGTKHCISCANGTEAMTLVLMAWGIKEGDAVFVPDFTFFSTGEVVSFLGATPIFVDIDEKTFNIDPIKLEKAIEKIIKEDKLNPKVIIPVDLFGLPAEYKSINNIAKKYNLLILEDAAQGFGGSINNKMACSFGDAATTSFFPAKPLGCYGDGGAIFTNDDELASLLNSLKVHGKGDNKYDNIRIGVNSRLDTIQSAILDIKLDAFINHELEDVNRVSDLYNKYLKEVNIELPFIPDNYISSFAQYTIKLKNEKERDYLKSELEKRNIPAMIYYIKPMHSQKAFSYIEHNEDDFNVVNDICKRVLSLPMHPYLSEEEIIFITDAIKEIIK